MWAESSQDTSHAFVRVWIHSSNERHAALTNVHAHGSAGDDLERFLLVGMAQSQVSAIQTNRDDVRFARHVSHLWLRLEPLGIQSASDAQRVLSHRAWRVGCGHRS